MIKEYQHKTTKSFEDVIETLKKSLMKRKFGTLCSIAMSEKFEEKGINYDGKLTILEVCNPFEASKIISINPKALYLLPCKIIVRENDNTTTVQMANPTSLIALFDDSQLLKIAQEIESTLIDAINEI
jgi:uncharacterized protein (DUF302 family)